MDKAYIPAIITGAAGIVGVIINISVSLSLRAYDVKIKNRENALCVLRQYYFPLCQQMSMLDSLYKKFTSLEQNHDITAYLSGAKTSSGSISKVISEFETTVTKAYTFINGEQSSYLDDYKMHYFSKQITVAIINWKNALDKHPHLACIYKSSSYESMVMRANKLERKFGSLSLVHRFYLKIWEYYMLKN